MKKLFVLLAALAVLSFAGCKKNVPEKKIKPADIAGTWKIESMTGFDISNMHAQFTVSADSKESEKYLLSGTTGLNLFFINLENAEESFPLSSQFATTKMAGSPEEMKIEDAMLEILSLGSWKLSENKLKISHNSKDLIFTKK